MKCKNIWCSYPTTALNIECGICVINNAFNLEQLNINSNSNSNQQQVTTNTKNTSLCEYNSKLATNSCLLISQQNLLCKNIGCHYFVSHPDSECSICMISSAFGVEKKSYIDAQSSKSCNLIQQNTRPLKKCPICKKLFARLSMHIKIHADKSFLCVECKYSSNNRYLLKRHINIVHRKIKAFKCPDYKCQMPFASRSKVKEHIYYSHSILKKPFPCLQCSASFIRKLCLTKHVAIVHKK